MFRLMAERKTKTTDEELPIIEEVWAEWSVSNGDTETVVLPERRIKLNGADGHELIVTIRSMSKVERAQIAATLLERMAFGQFAALLTDDSYREFMAWAKDPAVGFDPDTLWQFNVQWAMGNKSNPFAPSASTDS